MASIIRSGVTTPHPQPKDRRMRKAAKTPCKQRAFRDPPRTPAGPLPDRFPSNTPATRAAPATTNLEKRLEPRASKRLGQFRDCTVAPGLPSPPVNAVGASACWRAGAPAPAEALPSRLGGRRSDESEAKGFGKGGATITWFASFSGETVQAMVEPLFCNADALAPNFDRNRFRQPETDKRNRPGRVRSRAGHVPTTHSTFFLPSRIPSDRFDHPEIPPHRSKRPTQSPTHASNTPFRRSRSQQTLRNTP
jgi:hypothetical protein